MRCESVADFCEGTELFNVLDMASGAAQLGEQAKTVPQAMRSVHLRLVARITKVGQGS